MRFGDGARVTLEDCTMTSPLNGKSEVKLTIQVDGTSHSATGLGNGAYDAFARAIDAILSEHTDFSRPKLIDYEVHIPKGGQTNALTEASITWELANKRKMTTRGVHSNQVFAAIQATLKVINFELSV